MQASADCCRIKVLQESDNKNMREALVPLQRAIALICGRVCRRTNACRAHGINDWKQSGQRPLWWQGLVNATRSAGPYRAVSAQLAASPVWTTAENSY
jgi:hypothetical protein